jgi:hypothetical protein
MKRLNNSQIIEKVREDDRVYAALDDLITAIFVQGEDNVSCDAIKTAIASRIAAWADYEVEAEGLDGVA